MKLTNVKCEYCRSSDELLIDDSATSYQCRFCMKINKLENKDEKDKSIHTESSFEDFLKEEKVVEKKKKQNKKKSSKKKLND